VTLRRRLAVLALALASVPALAGCRTNSAPLQPTDPDRVEPAILIAEGTGAAGDYRAWIYRSRSGLTCLQVSSTSGNNGATCGAGEEGVMGLVGSSDDAGVFLTGGTRQPAAVSVIVHGRLGRDVTVPATLPAPGVTSNIRYFVASLPDLSVTSVDIVDAFGGVLETLPGFPG
jgi:hypothetical protein